MMRLGVKGWGIALAVTFCLGGGVAALAMGLGHVADEQALKNDSLTRLRTEALALFPRGSRLSDAEAHMARIGFACEPIPHALPDISAPSLQCASNGRGYPDFPAVNVILLSRNGLISDVDVWNIMARADGDPDGIDFTAIGASDALPPQLHRPDPGAEADAADRDDAQAAD